MRCPDAPPQVPQPEKLRYGVQVRVKNTFLHVADTSTPLEPEPQRSRTLPPRWERWQLEEGLIYGAAGTEKGRLEQLMTQTISEQPAGWGKRERQEAWAIEQLPGAPFHAGAEVTPRRSQRGQARSSSGPLPAPAAASGSNSGCRPPSPPATTLVEPLVPEEMVEQPPTRADLPPSAAGSMAPAPVVAPVRPPVLAPPSPLARQQPQTLASYPAGDGCLRTDWIVDARKLDGSDQQVVSPAIWFDTSDGSRMRFKMVLNPKKLIAGKRVSCFKKAMGKGFISLKCEGDHNGDMSSASLVVTLQMSIGSTSNSSSSQFRGLASHDFAKRAVCGLPKEQEEWDFRAAVDAKSQTFVVCLLLAEAMAVRAEAARAEPARAGGRRAMAPTAAQ